MSRDHVTRRTAGAAMLGMLGAALGGFTANEADGAPARGTRFDIEAQPITSFDGKGSDDHRFGRLSFRGGLVLTSSERHFGGLSGLVMLDSARFVAVTDRGHWVTGRIVYARDRPIGIADATIAPMLGPDDRALAQRGWYDTEALTADGTALYVGIERANRILRYEFGRDGVGAHGTQVAAPPETSRLPHNRGLEGLAFVPRGLPLGGTLIGLPERWPDQEGDLRALLIGGPKPGTFTIRRHDDFDISDAAVLAPADLLVLERRFAWTSGLAVRIRRIPLDAIAPGARVDGSVLMTADLGYDIDNMEAIGVHRAANGETVLTLLSDDNFSVFQRTLLLQFELDEA